MEEINRLVFCGDIHGELPTLVNLITSRYNLTNCAVVVVGDFGVGFESKAFIDQIYNRYKHRLEKNNAIIYAIRGNHDDPEYFKDPEATFNYERMKLLKDHTIYNIAGQKIYTIGGANSIDVDWRIEFNEQHKNTTGRKVWWEDEDIIKLDMDKLPTEPVDFIISHEAPLSFSPIISRTEEMSAEVYGKVLASRLYLNEVLKHMRAKYWIYGHYHNSFSGSYSDLIYRGLAINELFEPYINEHSNESDE